jgi:hypothetical protein
MKKLKDVMMNKFNINDVVKPATEDSDNVMIVGIVSDTYYFSFSCPNPEKTYNRWKQMFGEDIDASVVYILVLQKPAKPCTLKEVMEQYPEYDERQCQVLYDQMDDVKVVALPQGSLEKSDMTYDEFMAKVREYN